MYIHYYIHTQYLLLLHTQYYITTYIHNTVCVLYSLAVFSEPTPWTSTMSEVNVAAFNEDVGPMPSVNPAISVLSLFQMFFTPALVATIVEQTNVYARLILGDARPWRKVSDSDIWAFFGFCILMGINHLPALHHYWSSDPIFHYAPVADCISRDRFLAIWRFMHFTHASPPPTPSTPSPSTHQCSPARSSLQGPSRDHSCVGCHYRPNREQAVDEALVAFKGRSSMKQYLPMKPVKRGFKIWVRADSHNGYICQFECYTGRKGDTTEVGLVGSVVTRLTRDLVGKNYHIYMDSFFPVCSVISCTPHRQHLLYRDCTDKPTQLPS